MSALTEYGWTPDVQALFETHHPDALPGRVARVDRGSSLVVTELTTDRCFAPGSAPEHPVTGDWVAVTPEPGLGFVLDGILPRTGTLRRLDPSGDFEQLLVANVDVTFVLHGLDRPLHPRRIERLCLLSRDGGATPVVVITKTDLDGTDDAELDTLEAIDGVHHVIPGVDVIPVSGPTGAGLHLLGTYLTAGTTAALLGESGAGKSTLVNALVGEEAQATGETRSGDSKGRHTTTSRELVPLSSGAVLVDTPGLRAVAMVGDGTGLRSSYADVEDLFTDCRFRDCGHDTEPGCAVQAALESGDLTADRWTGYQKLRREIAYEARRAGDREAMAEFKAWNRKLAEFQRQRRRQ